MSTHHAGPTFVLVHGACCVRPAAVAAILDQLMAMRGRPHTPN
ncbi:hypothetical protein [Streptomyces sp. CA-132043]